MKEKTPSRIYTHTNVTGMEQTWSSKFRQSFPDRVHPSPKTEHAISDFPSATTTSYAKEKLAIQ